MNWNKLPAAVSDNLKNWRGCDVAFDHRRAVYIRRSPIFGFPDIVTVEFVALGPGRSSVAVYSLSRYGGYDFAKNRKRVERWLFVLQEVAHE